MSKCLPQVPHDRAHAQAHPPVAGGMANAGGGGAVSAVLSPCGLYRYRLERDGPGDGATAIIMVNPSTADASADDQTIRKLRGFGERNGWGCLIVGNLFAFRATDVRELGKTWDPIGPDNDAHLRAIFADADRIICAWGPIAKQPRMYRGLRWRQVLRLAGSRPLYSIGEPAKCGAPCHPLTLAYSRPIQQWPTPNTKENEHAS